MPLLLVVDDEPAILHAFRRVFTEPDVTLLTAPNPTEGIALVEQHHPDVIILDVEMPGMTGLEAFRRIRLIDAKVPIIFITGHAGTDEAIEATKLGALDYLFKPLELPEVRELVTRAFRVSRMMRVPATIAEGLPADIPGDVLVGRSPAMKEVYVAIGRVARRMRPCSSKAKAAQAKSWWRRPSTSMADVQPALFRLSTARPYPNRCWKANCSATKKGRSPGRKEPG